MTTFNLDAYSLAELKTLCKDVKAIAEFSDRKRTEAIAGAGSPCQGTRVQSRRIDRRQEDT